MGSNGEGMTEEKEIVHVQTRYVYDSYRDLRKLFTLAGFRTVYVDEIDISQPVVYIVSPMNGEWRPHIDNEHASGKMHLCDLILWNIERAGGSDTKSVGNYTRSNWDLMYQRHVDRVWVSDRRLAAETGLHYITLGSHPDFGTPGMVPNKIWDITHMSYVNGRRSMILDKLSRKGSYDQEADDDRISPNCWPPERDAVLQASRFALSIHQDDGPFLEPLRFALFAAYGLPILSETVFDAFPYSTDTMQFAFHQDLVGIMKQMLNSKYEKWAEMGQRCREMMTVKYEFGQMVRQAVKETVGDWR